MALVAVRSRSRAVTLVVVAGAQFLAVMSTSVVSVALPTIGRELHASTTALEWIVDAYVLVFASLLVAGGVLSDRRGRKPMFVLGVALFGTGSLLAGLAPTIGLLIAARVIQGIGPAIVLPGSLAIISAIFPSPRERAAAIGLWSASSGLALAVGPAFGGALVDGPGWRWVFLVNVPLCALLVGAALLVIPAIRPDPGRNFDLIGAIVYFSVYFQNVQGRTAADAGLLVLPIGAALALTAPVSGLLTGRLGARLPMLTGLVICGGATLGLLRLGPHSGASAEWWDFALIGVGAGLALTPMTATAVGAVRPERAGMASAVHNAMRQLGQVLGVAVLGALVYAGLGGASAGGRRLGPLGQQAYVDGLHHALWVAGLALLAAAGLVALLVPPGRTS